VREEWVVVSKQQATAGVKTELRAAPLARRREPVVHRLPAVPGKHLRTAVDTVLEELAASARPDVQAMHRLGDTLRSALAWTAAVGDTCLVAAAVDAVRDARSRLDAAEPDKARAALLTARDGLALPGPRTPH
jgi:hypothetical protein